MPRVQCAYCVPCRLPFAHHFPNQDGAVRAAPCGTVCYCALLLGVVPFHAAAARAGGSRNIHTPGYSRVLEGTFDAPSCRGIGLVAQEHGHGLNAEDFFSELTTSLKHRVRRPRGGTPKAVPGTVVGCFPYRRGQRYRATGRVALRSCAARRGCLPARNVLRHFGCSVVPLRGTCVCWVPLAAAARKWPASMRQHCFHAGAA